jgi:hypothetical protein
VYSQPAATERAPTRNSHGVVASASAVPAAAATAKASHAARLTEAGAASPLATSRTGPTRSASVPRTPSL